MAEVISVSIHACRDSDRMISWPRTLFVRPMLGDYIESKDRKHTRKVTRIEIRDGYLDIEVN